MPPKRAALLDAALSSKSHPPLSILLLLTILPPQPRVFCRSKSGIAGCSRRAQRRTLSPDALRRSDTPLADPLPMPATHAARRQPATVAASGRASQPWRHPTMNGINVPFINRLGYNGTSLVSGSPSDPRRGRSLFQNSPRGKIVPTRTGDGDEEGTFDDMEERGRAPQFPWLRVPFPWSCWFKGRRHGFSIDVIIMHPADGGGL